MVKDGEDKHRLQTKNFKLNFFKIGNPWGGSFKPLVYCTHAVSATPITSQQSIENRCQNIPKFSPLLLLFSEKLHNGTKCRLFFSTVIKLYF